ncbi:MAG: hypothetical protein V1644_01930 [Candidatus Micrarchaeota archaeon]
MKCPTCSTGRMKEKLVRFSKSGLFVGIFRTLVCDLCGEEVFNSNTAGKMEKKLKQIGLWGSSKSKVYKIKGNLAIEINKTAARTVGLTKKSRVKLIPDIAQKRIIIEIT